MKSSKIKPRNLYVVNRQRFVPLCSKHSAFINSDWCMKYDTLKLHPIPKCLWQLTHIISALSNNFQWLVYNFIFLIQFSFLTIFYSVFAFLVIVNINNKRFHTNKPLASSPVGPATAYFPFPLRVVCAQVPGEKPYALFIERPHS